MSSPPLNQPKPPRISVLMSSYNHAAFIEAAIESILRQSFRDFELIIVDDGSADDSAARIRRFADPRIRAEFREQNHGLVITKRRCLELARGEYLAVINSDDLAMPERLTEQAALLDSRPEVGAVLSAAAIIDAAGNPLADDTHFYQHVFDQPNRSRQAWLRHFFYEGNCLCMPSAMFRREAYAGIGLLDPRLRQLPDLDLWVRVCRQWELHILPRRLACFRVLEKDANASGNRPDNRIRDLWENCHILRHYLTIESQEELLQIFPEAGAFVTPEPLTPPLIQFVLARLAMAETHKGHQLKVFAADTVFRLMGDPETADLIHRRFGFTFRDLVDLTGKIDVFGQRYRHQLQQRLHLSKHQLELGGLREQFDEFHRTLGRSPRLQRVLAKIPRLKRVAAENERLWQMLEQVEGQILPLVNSSSELPVLTDFRPLKPSYFLSPKLGLAYLQIPKAACSSIKARLLAAENPERYRQLESELRTSVGTLHHEPGLFELSPDPGELLRFTFVRHPFDRVVSFYRNQVNPQSTPEARRQRLTGELALSGLTMGMAFADYVRMIVSDPKAAENLHIRPQVEFLCPPGGGAVDFLGRLETFDRSQRLLGRMAGLPELAFPKLNVTSSPSWQQTPELTPELVDLLARRYAQDLRLLGYSAQRP